MESQPAPTLITISLLLFSFLLFTHPCSSSTSSSSSSSSSPFSRKSRPSKSGYLVVNSTSGSSIFYAFYEAQKPLSPLSETPLLIWLQGGPGCSSMVGNFYELGPWRVNHTIQLEPNEGAWNRGFGLVFLDNPIGTGFSYAATVEEIPRDQHGLAKHLYIAINSFLNLNPLFRSRPVYITGESYAGKYAPAIGYYVLKKNRDVPDSERVNLGGVAIGNGLTDPETQVKTHAANAYFSGLINKRQRTLLGEAQREVVKFVVEKKWGEATDARNVVLDMLKNMTGLATLYDIRRKTPYESGLVERFLRRPEVKKALGANSSIVWEECNDIVGKVMHQDVMKSVKYMVELLVKESKVLLYQGQCDLRDGVVSTEAWMKKLRWDGIDKFQEAERNVWRVNGELAGYVQKWESLSHVVVLGAGHFVPTDQAVNSQAMIEDWVLERGLFASEKFEIERSAYPMNLL